MNRLNQFLVTGLILCVFAGWASTQTAPAAKPAAVPAAPQPAGEKPMQQIQLGNFSVSLTVKDLAASRAFYEKLGFRAKVRDNKEIGGKNWVVLQNDSSTIGLFQSMFDKNILTFNPGWDRNSAPLAKFDDVREIQKRLKSAGVALTTEADLASTGPASLTLVDPDGNMILVDQHVPAPAGAAGAKK